MQGTEETFTFLKTVLKEVLELFPHIDIGGDEVGHPAVSLTCCVSLLHHDQLCLCCSQRGDLLREITRLAKEGRFRYLMIESTGVSEPQQVLMSSPTHRGWS